MPSIGYYWLLIGVPWIEEDEGGRRLYRWKDGEIWTKNLEIRLNPIERTDAL